MRLVEANDSDDLGRRAAELVFQQLRAKPASVITLATGNTPLPLFRELVAASKMDAGLFKRAYFVTLDEYAGIAHEDRRRLLNWLRREFLEPAGIHDRQLIAFDPLAIPATESVRIEKAIEALGGLDLAVLGLGPNGHLGFNEPGSSFASRTRMVPLAAESIASNAAYWGNEDDVPSNALTLGLGTLREAQSIILMVSGAGKADVLARLLCGPISESMPATLLRLCSASVVMADRASLTRHYRNKEADQH